MKGLGQKNKKLKIPEKKKEKKKRNRNLWKNNKSIIQNVTMKYKEKGRM